MSPSNGRGWKSEVKNEGEIRRKGEIFGGIPLMLRHLPRDMSIVIRSGKDHLS